MDPVENIVIVQSGYFLKIILDAMIMFTKLFYMRQMIKYEGRYNFRLLNEIRLYRSYDFRSHFRLSRSNFERLLRVLNFELKSNRRVMLHVEIKLLAVLWLLATPECFKAVGLIFKLSKGTLHYAFVKIIYATQKLAPRVINWPTNIGAVKRSFNRHGLQNVVGAIDGSYIPIKKPIVFGDDYVCRKQFSAITLQGVCENSMRFTNCFTGWPASVHDARTLRNSHFYQKVMQHRERYFTPGDYILGDKAYPLKSWLITPYKNEDNLSQRQRLFNSQHSKTRVAIERAFALLKGRFRRLKYLDMEVKYIPATILACCVLHNICLEEDNDAFLQEGMRLEIGIRNEDHNYHHIGSGNEVEGTRLRNEITNNLIFH